jgi:hypothetical protein
MPGGGGAASYPSLQDLEWRLVVAASSDESESLGATRVQLKLRVEGRAAPLACELTVAQFYELLAEMEAAKSELDDLAS